MLLILIFLLLPCMVISLNCFECHIVEHSEFHPNKTQKLCDTFDHSEKFVRNCENSTFCRKTIIKGDISGVKVGVERDCVNHAYNLVVKYNKDGSWYMDRETIADAYKRGCSVVDSYGMKSVSIQHCYCNTDLCNSAMTISSYFFISASWLLITIT